MAPENERLAKLEERVEAMQEKLADHDTIVKRGVLVILAAAGLLLTSVWDALKGVIFFR